MSQLAEWHAAQGARPAPEGAPLPILTHGSVPEEYAAAIEGWALFDRSNGGALEIRGADAQGFLTRILAGDVRTLPVGHGQRNLLLSPKGKVLQMFDVQRTAEGFDLITPPGQAPALIAGLDAYHFGEDITWTDVSGKQAVFECLGPQAEAGLLEILEGPLPADPHGFTDLESAHGSVRVARALVAGRPGWRLQTPHAQAPELWQALVAQGARPAGLVAFDALRCEAAFALWGVDVDETIYPQEARLEDAFSLTKGCYIGQEVVAKIDTYGGLNKRLMLLKVSDDDPVPAGTRLLQAVEGKEPRDLGVVTTWAYSFAIDGGVVLAYVKRKHQAEGTVFELDASGRHATIHALPFDEA